jgi:uncharacterized membrane protein YbaN (DUF454 family)
MKKEEKTNNSSKLVKSRIIRWIFIIVGFIAFGLGTVGIVLPILPTVPFYLLAAFCFVRGSEKFANWFLNSKLYKNHVGNFAKHRVMTIYGELILLILVSTMLLISLWFINKLAMTIVFTILIACKYAYFVFRVTPVSKKEYLQIKENDALEDNKNIENFRENSLNNLDEEAN